MSVSLNGASQKAEIRIRSKPHVMQEVLERQLKKKRESQMDRHKAITNNRMTKLKAQDKAGIKAMKEIGDRSSSVSSVDPLDAEAIREKGVLEQETEEEKEARLLRASDTKESIRKSIRQSMLLLDDEDVFSKPNLPT